MAAGPTTRKTAGTPVLIGQAGANVRLERVTLSAGEYTEAWLQQLAFEHPGILPIGDFEPGFGELCAVAREVPCAHGYIDNLYITGTGEIVVAECKLWRNPQARREVVAQALDYVAALTQLSYEAFESACRKGQGMFGPSLYGLMLATPCSTVTIPRVIIAVCASVLGRTVISSVCGLRQEASSTSAKVKCAPAWPCSSSASASVSLRIPSPSTSTIIRPLRRLRATASTKSCSATASGRSAITP